MHYAWTTHEATTRVEGGRERSRIPGHLAWRVLYDMGHFPRTAAPTLRVALAAGQRTPQQMVDQYPIVNREVRQLLIDYVERRSPDMDYRAPIAAPITS